MRGADVVALARACHPLPSLTVTAVTVGLAAGTGRSTTALVTIAAAVLAGQLSVGWLNDVVDADRDAWVGRRGKPVASGDISERAVLVAVLIAAPLAVLLSLPSGLAATVAHLVALIAAWAYDLGIKGTAASVLPYAVAFGLLPAFVVLGLPGAPLPPVWLVAASACLGAAAHFANAMPDIADDLATGVRGLPHRLGVSASGVIASVLVLFTSVLLVFGPAGPLPLTRLLAVPLAAGILTAGLVRGRRPRSRAAFTAVLLVAVLDVVLLLATDVPTR